MNRWARGGFLSVGSSVNLMERRAGGILSVRGRRGAAGMPEGVALAGWSDGLANYESPATITATATPPAATSEGDLLIGFATLHSGVAQNFTVNDVVGMTSRDKQAHNIGGFQVGSLAWIITTRIATAADAAGTSTYDFSFGRPSPDWLDHLRWRMAAVTGLDGATVSGASSGNSFIGGNNVVTHTMEALESGWAIMAGISARASNYGSDAVDGVVAGDATSLGTHAPHNDHEALVGAVEKGQQSAVTSTGVGAGNYGRTYAIVTNLNMSG